MRCSCNHATNYPEAGQKLSVFSNMPCKSCNPPSTTTRGNPSQTPTPLQHVPLSVQAVLVQVFGRPVRRADDEHMPRGEQAQHLGEDRGVRNIGDGELVEADGVGVLRSVPRDLERGDRQALHTAVHRAFHKRGGPFSTTKARTHGPRANACAGRQRSPRAARSRPPRARETPEERIRSRRARHAPLAPLARPRRLLRGSPPAPAVCHQWRAHHPPRTPPSAARSRMPGNPPLPVGRRRHPSSPHASRARDHCWPLDPATARLFPDMRPSIKPPNVSWATMSTSLASTCFLGVLEPPWEVACGPPRECKFSCNQTENSWKCCLVLGASGLMGRSRMDVPPPP